MIVVELLIVGSTVVVSSAVWAGAWLTNKIHARDNPPVVDAKAEEKAILERARAQWEFMVNDGTETGKNRTIAAAKMREIDEKLIELARRQ